MSRITSVTCTGPVNIAVVKYWGKRDEKLILPVNSSLSVTLDQAQLCAKTSVAASASFTSDRMWLNGEEQSMKSERLQNVLKEIRRRARKRKTMEDSPAPLLDWHVHICSENNFPTAAGLASSAAGFACLVFSLAKLFGIEGDISEVARQGSGSACRSIYGGFVAWDMGTKEDGTDSLARQVAPESYWPDLRVIILVVSGKKKHVASTAGMQTSVKTSDLLKQRLLGVPKRMERMEHAIQNSDYSTFAVETMKDSNQMHAVCQDTYPPITYLTDTSRDIVRLLHAVNDFYSEIKVAYTFDAGPNACLYLPESSVSLIISLVKHFFPPQSNGDQFVQGLTIKDITLPPELLSAVPLTPNAEAIKYIIYTRVGPGPQVLDAAESLLESSGMPKDVTQNL